MRGGALVLALAACGRIGFSSSSGGDDGPHFDAHAIIDDSTSSPSDASLLTGACESGQGSGGSASCTCANDCNRTCPDGNCAMTCNGMSDCTFDCPGGGCTFTCNDSTCCEVSCTGGNCTFVATGQGDVDGSCGSGCTGDCTQSSDCTVACGSSTPLMSCPCTGPGCD
ncbi:MAG TPA: hypothetical protein VGG74_04625 [Kofleriaceae bacterium]